MKSLILASVLAVAAAPAFSAETWLPEYDQHVSLYVSDRIKPRLNLLPNFERLIDEKAHQHNLQIYVILTERGDELTHVARDDWARATLNSERLWDSWVHKPGFSTERSLVLLYMRDPNSDAGSTAIRCGNFLNRAGLNRDSLSSPNGPVMPAVKQFMRTDTQSGVLTILSNINGVLSGTYSLSGAGNTTASTQNSRSFGADLVFGLILAIGMVIFGMLTMSGGLGGGSHRRGWGSCSSSSYSSCSSSSCSGSSCSSSSCSGGSSCGSSCGGGGGD